MFRVEAAQFTTLGLSSRGEELRLDLRVCTYATIVTVEQRPNATRIVTADWIKPKSLQLDGASHALGSIARKSDPDDREFDVLYCSRGLRTRLASLLDSHRHDVTKAWNQVGSLETFYYLYDTALPSSF